MTGEDGSRKLDGGIMSGALARAASVGFVLILLATTSWLLIRAYETEPSPAGVRLRRSQFATVWQSVAEGQTIDDVIGRMGPPDEEREQFESIPVCEGTCGTPCDRFHLCVRRYEWASAPQPESASVYSVCADAEGIVRQAGTGMRFKLSSVNAWTGPSDILAWTIGALALALPVAGVLILKRRIWPRRFTELTTGGSITGAAQPKDEADRAW